jgi:hypothetical protein
VGWAPGRIVPPPTDPGTSAVAWNASETPGNVAPGVVPSPDSIGFGTWDKVRGGLSGCLPPSFRPPDRAAAGAREPFLGSGQAGT